MEKMKAGESSRPPWGPGRGLDFIISAMGNYRILSKRVMSFDLCVVKSQRSCLWRMS